MCAWLVESFPSSVRLTSVAIGYNIAQAFVGGSTPALATWLAGKQLVYPGFMISFIAILAVTGLCIAPPKTESEEEFSSPTEPDSFISYSDEDEDDDISYEKKGNQLI